MPAVEIKSKIRVRRGTKAELDALPVGQKPLLAEMVYTYDTNQLWMGVDADTPPQVIASSAFADLTPELPGESRYRGGAALTSSGAALNAAGTNSLDIQSLRSNANNVAGAGNSVCYGINCATGTDGSGGSATVAIGNACTANRTGSVAIGRNVTAATGIAATALGNSLTNNVGSSIVVGHTNAIMRGVSSNMGWIQTILSSATARTATASVIADAPVASLPLGYFGFRRNGNQILIDINTDGTVRTLSLGTAT